MKAKSKWMLASVSSVLAATIMLPTANASTLNELKNQQKQVEQRQSELRSGISQKANEIQTNQSTLEKIAAQIQELNAKIEETERKIEDAEGKIADTNAEIDALKASIAELERKIAEREELLKERARAIQKSGGSVEYIDVLLGANSFVDFIDRVSAVNTLIEADREIMREQAEDKKLLGEQKAEVEKKLKEQEQRRAELVSLKKSLDGQKKEQAELKKKLEAEQARLQKEKGNLENAHAEAVEVSSSLEKKIIAEQERLAEIARQQELERQRKLAAERKAREEARRAAAAEAARQKAAERRAAQQRAESKSESVSSSSSKSSSSASAAASEPKSYSAPTVSSGWVRPASGRITSTVGGRDIGAGYEEHKGVDVANSIGTPIVAARDGIVSYAGSMGTYGNVIMITHSVSGQMYTTVYAHLSSIGVSSGQSVSGGQYIGGMGSTGRSTGSHLHFELHVGSWNGARTNYVNPFGTIPF